MSFEDAYFSYSMNEIKNLNSLTCVKCKIEEKSQELCNSFNGCTSEYNEFNDGFDNFYIK